MPKTKKERHQKSVEQGNNLNPWIFLVRHYLRLGVFFFFFLVCWGIDWQYLIPHLHFLFTFIYIFYMNTCSWLLKYMCLVIGISNKCFKALKFKKWGLLIFPSTSVNFLVYKSNIIMTTYGHLIEDAKL